VLRTARPTVGVVRDQLKVSWRRDVFSPDDVLALLAWAAPEAVLAAIEREIVLPERSGAMSANERNSAASRLTA
jgi:hypothetical protein